MYMRSVFRQSYYFSKSYGCDFEDTFQNGILGLMKAIEAYDMTSAQTFPSYYSFYVLATMQRNYEKKNPIYTLPFHLYDNLFSFLSKYKNVIEKYGIDNFLDFVPETILRKQKNENPDIYKYLLPKVDYDFDKVIYYDSFENDIIYQEMHKAIKDVLLTIPLREREILQYRFGFSSAPKTLEKIAEKFGLTRERIRQIEKKAIRRLCQPKIKNVLMDYMKS